MYRAKVTFRDLEDGHLYQTDEPFPFDGREIRDERVQALLSGNNAALRPLIYEDKQIFTPEPKALKTPKKRLKTKE